LKLVRLVKICLNEIYSIVKAGKNLSDEFPFQNGLKEGDALSPLLFSFGVECAIQKIQENQKALEVNGIHQILIYAASLSILSENISTIKKNTETVLEANSECIRNQVL
jgi:hypothetical protein